MRLYISQLNANFQAASNDAEAERLAKDAEFFKERLREAEELLSKYKTDNMMLHQRVEMAERDRGAMEHGNFLELEKVRSLSLLLPCVYSEMFFLYWLPGLVNTS